MSIFDSIPIKKKRRTTFNLSHEVKLSGKIGQLMPILCKEVLPGDIFRIRNQQVVRLAPTLAPLMQNVNVYIHYFFVPNRLLWSDWKNFITGGTNGDGINPKTKTAYELPYTTVGDIYKYIVTTQKADLLGSLPDYLGLPVTEFASNNTTKVSTLPFRAYQLIYNEYFRDQNLDEEVEIDIDKGGYDKTQNALFLLRNRCFRKDYFTSALPWTQRGPEVSIPLVGSAPFKAKEGDEGQLGAAVTLADLEPGDGTGKQILKSATKNGDARIIPTSGNLSADSGDGSSVGRIAGGIKVGSTFPDTDFNIDPNGTLRVTSDSLNESIEVDLNNASATTINELRRLTSLQQWLEANARGGARYIEQIFSHFGVKSSDARLQRPEYLGGGTLPIIMSEVLQSSETTESSALGTMAGHGISAGNVVNVKRYFEEHGFIIGIMSVLPKSAYYQGVPRMWSRVDKMDYYWPEFAHLGEQEIKNKELYLKSTNPEATFGYTPRYAEYKTEQDHICGQFRTSLNFWHMARKFDNEPKLNSSFVHCDETKDGLNRVFAVTDSEVEHLWIQVYNDIKASRLMPRFSIPKIV